MKALVYISLSSLCLLFLAIRLMPTTPLPPPRAADEKLLVVLQEADQHFKTSCLPALQEWCSTEGIELKMIDAATGSPSELTATPAIVYQNERGRAVYASRYSEFGTIKNFVRTNRLRPQITAPLCTEQVLQYASGRATLNAPLKVTELQGVLPSGWEATAFQQQAKRAIAEGMSQFAWVASGCLERTDRAFYCDFHPYRSADGELYLSLELYSMFNCIRPVYSTGEQPLKAAFDDYEGLFREAGQLLQAEIMRQTQQSEQGDAWTPLSEEAPTRSWAELGFALPANANQQVPPRTDFVVARQWEGAAAVVPGVPALSFRFQAPLDRYAGEVPDFSGELSLNERGELMEGAFTAKLKSLTMGMTELDDKVKKKYIYAKRFPEASFRFELPEGGLPLRAGQLNRVAVPGTFSFMKEERPMTVQAELTPILSEQGEQQLLVHVLFDLNITQGYGIAGPDGPVPARETMVFDLNFIMSSQ